jgi:hypothetical protein
MFEPGPPRSPLLKCLLSLETTVERVAAGQFTRDALAVARNASPRPSYDLGRSLLNRLAATGEAHCAAKRTLELAEELQGIVRMKARDLARAGMLER